MKKRFPAVLTAAVLLLSMTGCGGEEAALQEGVRDTNPDKGLAVMGNHVTYDPNHLVNGGEPVTLDWWLWDAPDLFGSIAREYQEMHPNVTIRIINNPWDGYWTKLPLALQNAMGIALYGMFIALIVPASRESVSILIIVLIAVAVNCALQFIPAFSFISSGFRIILATFAGAGAGALLFPKEEEDYVKREAV